MIALFFIVKSNVKSCFDLERSTLFYISYGHGCIKVCDYANGKMLGQLMLVKQPKNTNMNDLRTKTYYPLAWMDANTLLAGNLE